MACDGLCYAWAVRELKHKREGRAPRGLSARHEPGARVELRGRGRGAAASGFAPMPLDPLSDVRVDPMEMRLAGIEPATLRSGGARSIP